MNVHALRAFFDDPSRPSDVPRYHGAQGFLFAVASAPEMVSPTEWLPLLLDGLQADRRMSEIIVEEMMTLYNDVVAGVVEGAPALPDDCEFRDDVLANLEIDAPVSQWSRGFVHGHTWLEESWSALAPEELDEDIGSAILVLSFFASPGLANGLIAEIGATDLAETAARMREMFPLAMEEYARIGLEIDAAAHTPVRVEKTGRNHPCPCGSGKKYKKCCGA